MLNLDTLKRQQHQPQDSLLQKSIKSSHSSLFTFSNGPKAIGGFNKSLAQTPCMSQNRVLANDYNTFCKQATLPQATFGASSYRTSSWIAPPRSSLVKMQASAVADVAVEVGNKETRYAPVEFGNRFIERSSVKENPLSKVAQIGTDIRYQKVPQLNDLTELASKTTKFISDRQAKFTDNVPLRAYQGLRTGFFAANAVYSAVNNNLQGVLYNRDSEENIELSSDQHRENETKSLEIWVRLLEDYEKMADIDAENIQKGYYRMPWTGQVGHRELNPAYVITKIQQFQAEASENIKRQGRNGRGKDELPYVSGMYPKYYMNNFHFQSDGWLSSRSSKAYEFSTESLFFGSQDAMQRQALVPLKFWMNKQTKQKKDMKVLEIAGGTGRYMTFFRDNYPEIDATLLDLSPFYLEEARKNDDYFRKFFKSQDDRGKNMELSPLKLVQGNAEKLDGFETDQFDILNVIYLFHEIPPEARRAAAKEFFRVLRPGGICCFNDSIQSVDRPDRKNIGNFSKMNEPFYLTFIDEDLNQIFFDAGFKPGLTTKIVANSSKIMCWVKPEVNDDAQHVQKLQEQCQDLYAEIKIREEKIIENNVKKNEAGTVVY